MLPRCACVAVVVFLSAIPAFGQGFATGEFSGTVVDQSGGALPGATITATEEATGLVRTATPNDTGRFVLPAMQPGLYTMKAELSGFQTQVRTGLRLVVGQAVTLLEQLPVRRVHAAAAELIDREALHDRVAAALAGDRIRVHDTLADAIAAVGRHRHADPVALRRAERPVAHVIDRGGGSGGRG